MIITLAEQKYKLGKLYENLILRYDMEEDHDTREELGERIDDLEYQLEEINAQLTN